jgi:hypothetical protein
MAKNLFNSVHYADVCNLQEALCLAENQIYSIILADNLKFLAATLRCKRTSFC